MSTSEVTSPVDVLSAAFEEPESSTPTEKEVGSETAPAVEGKEPEAAQGDEPAKAAESEAKASSYEPFTMPEGIAVNQDLLDKATPLFEQMKLSQEQAQGLVDLYAQSEIARAAALHEQQAAERQAWVEAVAKDKQLSDPFAMASALKLVKEYGDKDLITLFDQTGVGSHPALVRFMQKVAAKFSEDQLEHGRTVPPPKDRNPIEVLQDFIAGGQNSNSPE